MARKKKRVYIASPYTIGDKEANVRRQIDAFDALFEHGYIPFAPLFSHYQHAVHPRSYDDWIEYDLEWLEQCDALLRLDGESKGADIEVKHAEKIGIPVYYSTKELVLNE